MMNNRNTNQKLTIMGAGITGLLEAYAAFLDAERQGKKIRITLHEKNKAFADTTTMHIVPSLTLDEILAVIPQGKDLIEKLTLSFKTGGTRVELPNVNDSLVTENFTQSATVNGYDKVGHDRRTDILLNLGKVSMDMWQALYEHADQDLKAILKAANFKPCHEPQDKNQRHLDDGYRIDLIYKMPNAQERAKKMIATYTKLGYAYSQILSPAEVKELNPALTDFCEQNAIRCADGSYQWRNDAIAIWRPGGCINTQIFLPLFFEYLQRKMGQYKNEQGHLKNYLQLHLGREVTGIEYSDANQAQIKTLCFNNGVKHKARYAYEQNDFVFCPGEAVGTLNRLGLAEPHYGIFAGVSLMLNIVLPPDKISQYASFNNWMEIHQVWLALAWQATSHGTKVSIGVAGTKAYYGDQKPDKHHEFAIVNNLVQLNVINEVMPDLISIALGKDTKGKQLTQADMDYLEQHGIAERWAGARAVAYDGFPTLGQAYTANAKPIANARCTTHLGSGGVSFAPAAVFFSRAANNKSNEYQELANDVLHYADARRKI